MTYTELMAKADAGLRKIIEAVAAREAQVILDRGATADEMAALMRLRAAVYRDFYSDAMAMVGEQSVAFREMGPGGGNLLKGDRLGSGLG